jgi:hypothetical protein
MPKAVDEGGVDPRTNVRSNVFLSAVMLAAGVTRPVRIRNISPTGALLDGTGMPPEGSIVHLRRGSLSVEGTVAWQERDQCGVRFDVDVVVQDWVKRVEHSGQARVDELVAFVRSAPSDRGGPAGDEERGDCLKSISADLASSCERIANLPTVVAECADEILKLDAIAQRLTHFVEAAHQEKDA